MSKQHFELVKKQLEYVKALLDANLLPENVGMRIQEQITIQFLKSVDSSNEPLYDQETVTVWSERSDAKMLSKSGPFRVFICYAHKDNESSDSNKRWLDRFLEHLQPLVLQGQVCAWSDRDIEIGDEWHDKIQMTLKNAKAAVLLVSLAFLASKYIRNSEVPLLLKNARDKGVIIVSIILRPCLLHETKFKYPDPMTGPDEFSLSSLQAANSPDKPLNGLTESEQDQVLLSVAQRLCQIVEHDLET